MLKGLAVTVHWTKGSTWVRIWPKRWLTGEDYQDPYLVCVENWRAMGGQLIDGDQRCRICVLPAKALPARKVKAKKRR